MGDLSPTQRQALVRNYNRITSILQGVDGAAGLGALTLALCNCSKAVGMTKEQIKDSIDKMWDAPVG